MQRLTNLSPQTRPEWLRGLFLFFAVVQMTSYGLAAVTRSPADASTNMNPDTHLQLVFSNTPVLGTSGQIRVYNAADDRLVDLLDLNIPPGPIAPTPSPSAVYTPVPYRYADGHFTNANTRPGTPSGAALPTSDKYQLTIIGGFTEMHFIFIP